MTNTDTAANAAPRASSSPRAVICEVLNDNFEIFKSYMPAHVAPRRFMALATRAVLDNPDLWECTANSLCKAIAAAAASGLPIDGKMSSLVVRRSKHGRPIAVWDPSYRGMVYLALESGHVTAVDAFAVFQRDEFSVELGTDPRIVHKTHLAADRGPVIAAYATATLKAGGVVREVLGAEDLRKIKASSPAGDKGPWSTWPERMALKSAVRRLLKRLPAAEIGTLERARQHIVDHDAGDAFRATLEMPEKQPAKPEDTTDLEARALGAIGDAGTAGQLLDIWNGIRAEFRTLDADIPLAIEARYHDRRESLSRE